MLSNKHSIHIITAPEMRAINRSSVIEYIRCIGPVSRSQIAGDLQINLPTVIRIVGDLITDGWVQETGTKEWSGGRKRALVKFNGCDHLIIGIDLGGTKIFGTVADVNGNILYEMNFDHHQSQAEESLHVVRQVIDALLFVAAQKELPVRGIGISVPGITFPETGIVSLAPALDWQEFPLKVRLQERYLY
jgi:hypothetical protein